MAIGRLSFNNSRRGKQPRANILLRWKRMINRKRVAWHRGHLADTLALAQRQIIRFEAVAAKLDVPIDPVPPLPVIPTLPGREWVEFKQAMGDLREPVKPAPSEPVTA